MVAVKDGLRTSDLRNVLKDGTRGLHDELDASLGHAALDARSYTAFLSIQYAARAPIERWASTALSADLLPPATADLIAADLEELRVPLPFETDFTWPGGADPIGFAWALGGSSMGNRAMLVQRRKAGFAGADRFLSDPATALYFRALLPRLAAPVSAQMAGAAVLAAEAVFTTFLSATRAHHLEAAA